MIDISRALPRIPNKTDVSIAYAMQALYRGEATAEQQKKAIDWIVGVASDAYGYGYISEKPYDTAFLNGRQAVGKNVIELANADITTVLEIISKLDNGKRK